MSFPPGTEMFQFPGFASTNLCIQIGRYSLRSGLPHSDIHGSTPARGSPWLFAACHVLHRLLVPRHPPNALLALEIDPPCTGAIHTQNPGHEPTRTRQASILSTTHCGRNRHHERQRTTTPLNTFAFDRGQPVFRQKYRLPVRHATDSAPRDAPEPDSP